MSERGQVDQLVILMIIDKVVEPNFLWLVELLKF